MSAKLNELRKELKIKQEQLDQNFIEYRLMCRVSVSAYEDYTSNKPQKMRMEGWHDRKIAEERIAKINNDAGDLDHRIEELKYEIAWLEQERWWNFLTPELKRHINNTYRDWYTSAQEPIALPEFGY